MKVGTMGKIMLTNILTIGKDPFTLAIYEQHLRNAGYVNIVLIIEKDTCLQYLDIKPCVVLIEVEMLALHGAELLQSIKVKSPDTYIVIISSKSNLSKAEELLDFGVFDIVVKGPYMATSIVEVLENIRLMKVLMQKVPGEKHVYIPKFL